MRSKHSLDRLQVCADDEHLVANAGLVLAATLAQHLGFAQLVRTHVNLGTAPGRANVDHKALTLVYAILVGADSIDDADMLRAGDTVRCLATSCARPRRWGRSCAPSPRDTCASSIR